MEANLQETAAARPPRVRRPLSRRKKLVFSLLLFSFTLVLCWGGSITWRSIKTYRFLQANHQGWGGPLHRADAELGYSMLPSADTFHVMQHHENVPVYTDEHGFRTTKTAATTAADDRPAVLFFGCSHTFGYGCQAEDTYPQIVAAALDAKCCNAAVCGYGLAQMLLRGRDLISRLKPAVVVVQYSPWLLERSTQYFSPSFFGKLPCPYFVETDDEVSVEAPAFTSKLFDLPFDEYRRSGGGTQSLAFLFKAGGPLYAHDDACVAGLHVKRLLRMTPNPTDDHEKAASFAYGEFAKLCREHGCKLVILNMQFGIGGAIPQSVKGVSGATLVDADSVLVSRLPEHTAEAYSKAYYHWGGDPPVVVDAHPNAAKHRIIAEAVIEALKGQRFAKQDRPSRN